MDSHTTPKVSLLARVGWVSIDAAWIAALAYAAFGTGANVEATKVFLQIILWPMAVLMLIIGVLLWRLDEHTLIQIMKFRALRDSFAAHKTEREMEKFDREYDNFPRLPAWKLWTDPMLKSRYKPVSGIYYSFITGVVEVALIAACGFYWLALATLLAELWVKRTQFQARRLYPYRYKYTTTQRTST